MSLADKIYAAFKANHRQDPAADASRPFISDRQDAESIGSLSREDLEWGALQKHADALYAMTPVAFRYYLPQFMVRAMEQHGVTPLFVLPVLQMLDAGPDEFYWSDRFKELWVGMTVGEYEAIKAWLVFMASSEHLGQDQAMLARAFDTVDLLSRATTS
jgi:hypothetical protein